MASFSVFQNASAHQTRLPSAGRPSGLRLFVLTGGVQMTLDERFWSKVDVRGDDECWHWTAGRSCLGYGRFRVNGRTVFAHRVAWELMYGVPPHGSCICHHCDTPGCVNPAHLFAGTHSDNMADMAAKGRAANNRVPQPGSLNGRSKLTSRQVALIRLLPSQMSNRSIGNTFGVSHETIRKVKSYESWRSD